MKHIDANILTIVRGAFKGKKLEKLDKGLALLAQSIDAGGWVPGASRTVSASLYQGICRAYIQNEPDSFVCTSEWYASNGVSSCLNYGGCPSYMTGRSEYSTEDHPFDSMSMDEKWNLGVETLRKLGNLKLSDEVLNAWREFTLQVAEAREALDARRPAPVRTEVGFSPKVTKTLTELNLKIDLKSVVPAKIAEEIVPQFNDDGSPKMVRDRRTGKLRQAVKIFFYVDWTPGIKHNASRFASGGHCHACGKYIPSGQFVPVEAKCEKSGLVSMWLGCDCARQVFGIKAEGLRQDAKKGQVANG